MTSPAPFQVACDRDGLPGFKPDDHPDRAALKWCVNFPPCCESPSKFFPNGLPCFPACPDHGWAMAPLPQAGSCHVDPNSTTWI